MNIVVTGATSFVGTGAVKELLKRGHHVYAVLRVNSGKSEKLFEKGKQPVNLTILEEDISSLINLPFKIKEPCDVFLHMAWRGAGSDSRKNEEIQMDSVQDAMDAVKAAKALGCGRFLFTGSQAEYGIHDTFMTEESECRPTSPYGQAKLEVLKEAKMLCGELGMDYGHARIFSTYGPGDHPWSLLSTCMKVFGEGGMMELSDCTQKWNFLYIEDAGCALADLVEYEGNLTEQGSVFNLAGPIEETRPLRDFVEQLYILCGSRGTMNYGVHPANAEGVVNLIPDISKLERVTGWSPKIRFEQGIRKILRNL